jgi:hypothetical protein
METVCSSLSIQHWETILSKLEPYVVSHRMQVH